MPRGAVRGLRVDSTASSRIRIEWPGASGGKISEEWAGGIATIMTQIGAFSPPWAA